MNIELSEREIELIMHMLTESMSENTDGEIKLNFSMDEIILLEKLEHALRCKDFSSFGYRTDIIKTKRLN